MPPRDTCKITINGDRELSVEKGQTLLTSLWRHNVLVPSVCGGRGMCGVCKVRIVKGAEAIAMTPAEQKRLTDDERNRQVRLACQIRIDNDLAIEVPADFLAVRRWQTRCEAIEELTYDTRRFRFELIEPARMNFIAGHYVQLVSPSYAEGVEPTTRAFSIASNPADSRHIELIIRRAPNGICTTWLFDYLKPGDTVEMTGPYGEFHLSDSDTPMIFIAGGSGMAPFVSILHRMKNAGSTRKTEYFFGANRMQDLYLTSTMQEFEKALPNFRFVPVLACPTPQDNWQGETGLVTEAVKRRFTDLRGHEGYLCGSPGMIDASIKVLLDLGIPQDKIYYDKFA
jgi:Na+-transporting NADH:ubiquinone oxidoreductase subunit F